MISWVRPFNVCKKKHEKGLVVRDLQIVNAGFLGRGG